MAGPEKEEEEEKEENLQIYAQLEGEERSLIWGNLGQHKKMEWNPEKSFLDRWETFSFRGVRFGYSKFLSPGCSYKSRILIIRRPASMCNGESTLHTLHAVSRNFSDPGQIPPPPPFFSRVSNGSTGRGEERGGKGGGGRIGSRGREKEDRD